MTERVFTRSRGPPTTAGIESSRDGDFRRWRSAFRIEIGNEGWNVPIGDRVDHGQRFHQRAPTTRAQSDHAAGAAAAGGIAALRRGGARAGAQRGDDAAVPAHLSRRAEPMSTNRVTLHPTLTDGLGIPRPKIDYSFDEYTLNGFRAARRTCSAIYERIGATEFTDFSGRKGQPGYFEIDGVPCNSPAPRHVVGTHRMGSDRTQSVVDRSNSGRIDHRNLWISRIRQLPDRRDAESDADHRRARLQNLAQHPVGAWLLTPEVISQMPFDKHIETTKHETTKTKMILSFVVS